MHVDGVRTFYRRVAGRGPPAVFVHGNPTHSEDWLPFLERSTARRSRSTCPGWGVQRAPAAGRFDYSMHGLGRFLERFLDALGIERARARRPRLGRGRR